MERAMSDQKPMQADGQGTKRKEDGPEIASRKGGAGESGGGAYPNPHTGKGQKSNFGGFFGHGGQTEIAYHGGDNPNATTEEE
jgi:hypothetical protein